jgi:hypothetical protein
MIKCCYCSLNTYGIIEEVSLQSEHLEEEQTFLQFDAILETSAHSSRRAYTEKFL